MSIYSFLLKFKAYRCINYLPKKMAVKINYFCTFKKRLDLKNPKTLNEKIQFMQLYGYGDKERICSDKYLVRKYIEKKGLGDILPKLYGVWDKAEQIEFDSLPDSFVLKANHGSGYNIICKDKKLLDIKKTKKTLKKWLKEDFSKESGEFHYQKIKRKIICEEYLEDREREALLDYKYFCFDGKPDCILVCVDRDEDGESKHKYYDTDWNELDYASPEIASNEKIARPKNLDKMNEICKKLAKGFPFVRVDLYDINDKIYFGELTFTPIGGRITCQTDEAQKHLGELLHIGRK